MHAGCLKSLQASVHIYILHFFAALLILNHQHLRLVGYFNYMFMHVIFNMTEEGAKASICCTYFNSCKHYVIDGGNYNQHAVLFELFFI